MAKKTSEEIRQGYRERLILPEFCEEDIVFSTKSGLRIAEGYVRVVVGDRGPYIEFDDFMMKFPRNIMIPQDQMYRIRNALCYYIEYRTTDESYVKIYKQKKLVKYADYQIGFWYISPFDLISDKYPELIKKLEGK
jgi:hypothetical protein